MSIIRKHLKLQSQNLIQSKRPLYKRSWLNLKIRNVKEECCNRIRLDRNKSGDNLQANLAILLQDHQCLVLEVHLSRVFDRVMNFKETQWELLEECLRNLKEESIMSPNLQEKSHLLLERILSMNWNWVMILDKEEFHNTELKNRILWRALEVNYLSCHQEDNCLL